MEKECNVCGKSAKTYQYGACRDCLAKAFEAPNENGRRYRDLIDAVMIRVRLRQPVDVRA